MKISKIEKGIPFTGEGLYPFKMMRIGDSFNVEVEEGDDIRTIFRVQNYAYVSGIRQNKTFRTRSSKNDVRVWRTK